MHYTPCSGCALCSWILTKLSFQDWWVVYLACTVSYVPFPVPSKSRHGPFLSCRSDEGRVLEHSWPFSATQQVWDQFYLHKTLPPNKQRSVLKFSKEAWGLKRRGITDWGTNDRSRKQTQEFLVQLLPNHGISNLWFWTRPVFSLIHKVRSFQLAVFHKSSVCSS